MADYLVLKHDGSPSGVTAWKALFHARGLSEDPSSALQALRGAYSGPGRYAVVRTEPIKTATISGENVTVTPQVAVDATPRLVP